MKKQYIIIRNHTYQQFVLLLIDQPKKNTKQLAQCIHCGSIQLHTAYTSIAVVIE